MIVSKKTCLSVALLDGYLLKTCRIGCWLYSLSCHASITRKIEWHHGQSPLMWGRFICVEKVAFSRVCLKGAQEINIGDELRHALPKGQESAQTRFSLPLPSCPFYIYNRPLQTFWTSIKAVITQNHRRLSNLMLSHHA